MDAVNSIVNSPTAYLTLFIMLLWYVLSASQKREKEMREQLDKIVPILDHLVREIEDIKDTINRKGE